MTSIIDKQFIKAAKNNRLDELKKLLSQGADSHANNDGALKESAFHGHLDVVTFLVLPDLGSVAIANGANGANIHANNDEALRWATTVAQLEIVKFLVTQGAISTPMLMKFLKQLLKKKTNPY